MSIWECIELLNEFVDESDPDLDEPQIEHLLQTAEAIRKDYPEEDWLHLTGLIHDLGKVLLHPSFGQLPQWAVVGDTFPVGCAFDECNVHHKYFEENPDHLDPKYNTKLGEYSEGCGLENVLMSWGHDDYMYLVAKGNKTSLPLAGLFIIRYHSFYPLHKHGAYQYLMNEEDKENLKWLHVFNKYDLYSKSKVRIDVEKVKPYYLSLIEKCNLKRTTYTLEAVIMATLPTQSLFFSSSSYSHQARKFHASLQVPSSLRTKGICFPKTTRTDSDRRSQEDSNRPKGVVEGWRICGSRCQFIWSYFQGLQCRIRVAEDSGRVLSNESYSPNLKYDLYSKSKVRIDVEKVKPYYLSVNEKLNLGGLSLRQDDTATSFTQPPRPTTASEDEHLVSKIHAILDAVADRAEMHAIIGAQRNDWNHLFTNSINAISLTASLMAGISSIPVGEAAPHMLAFKLSSVILFTAATGMMLITSKIQPSQLAEEQRNATRLWEQLGRSIETTLALRAPTQRDVDEAMEKVLALDKAYPLPLLPGMLEKFPEIVEPTRWWPKIQPKQSPQAGGNGWSHELEGEMRGILRVLKAKDEQQYTTLGKLLLNMNKTLAISGPLLAGLAAISSGLIGSPALGPMPAFLGVIGGVLATAVHTLEHGGQVGMVFELFRNCAGYYRRLQEEIASNLGETDVQKRENGELFEMKVALQLGRSLSDLKGLASYASPLCEDEDIKEFAGKLF
ncbi:F-box protein [Musa troglodytarum]|nr:F-box protein [Musa troglodytarum]